MFKKFAFVDDSCKDVYKNVHFCFHVHTFSTPLRSLLSLPCRCFFLAHNVVCSTCFAFFVVDKTVGPGNGPGLAATDNPGNHPFVLGELNEMALTTTKQPVIVSLWKTTRNQCWTAGQTLVHEMHNTTRVCLRLTWTCFGKQTTALCLLICSPVIMLHDTHIQ